jgi:glycosyltransferase involved in cell wall biosynthesis
MRVLFISNLFPNPAEPTRGIHNAQQVAALSKLCRVSVIAPVAAVAFAPARKAAGTAAVTGGNAVPVCHPKFFHIPLLTRPFNGWLFARAIEPAVRREKFDVALVNWAYPDAYGVMLLAGKFGFPFATTVQGSDVNVLFENPARKRQILRALRASRAVFCRSDALREKLRAEGIEARTVYNGIDREKFRPLDRVECCRKLGLDPDRKRVLFVGNLLPVKGPGVLARAQVDAEVIFVGSGPEKIVAGRCVGARPHDEIPVWMNASDVLCLPSLNEGMPNVALEAMACGVPVVASRVGGVPEILHEGVNGFMVPPADPVALAEALRRALATKWDRDAIRASVGRFDWDVNARTVLETLRKIACN